MAFGNELVPDFTTGVPLESAARAMPAGQPPTISYDVQGASSSSEERSSRRAWLARECRGRVETLTMIGAIDSGLATQRQAQPVSFRGMAWQECKEGHRSPSLVAEDGPAEGVRIWVTRSRHQDVRCTAASDKHSKDSHRAAAGRSPWPRLCSISPRARGYFTVKLCHAVEAAVFVAAAAIAAMMPATSADAGSCPVRHPSRRLSARQSERTVAHRPDPDRPDRERQGRDPRPSSRARA